MEGRREGRMRKGPKCRGDWEHITPVELVKRALSNPPLPPTPRVRCYESTSPLPTTLLLLQATNALRKAQKLAKLQARKEAKAAGLDVGPSKNKSQACCVS